MPMKKAHMRKIKTRNGGTRTITVRASGLFKRKPARRIKRK
jgi:hypothetical protein